MAGPLSSMGMGIQLAGAVGSIFGNKRANKRLDALLAQNPTYQSNPIAAQRMALAQQLLNARQPGAAAAERNIYGSQANTISNINRNATDASQALMLAAGTQGQTNAAFGDLAQQEAAGYQQRYQNLSQAQQGVIEEGDKEYQDRVRRFQDLAAIRGAQNRNSQNNWTSISNFGGAFTNYGLAAEQSLANMVSGGMLGGGSGGMSGGGGMQGGMGGMTPGQMRQFY